MQCSLLPCSYVSRRLQHHLQMQERLKQCIKSLWKDIPIRSATNLKDLDIAVLKLAAANAAETKAKFEKAFNATGKNANVMTALKQCAQDDLVRCERVLASVEVQLPMLVSTTNFWVMLYRDVAFLVTSQLLNI
ncbi:DNA polymerase epsilon catalytic subunit A-like [Pyrus ussuriensis x Pyrus communis]|uniref:DNA polymerase epsilon catalytic subunit A-like n=1 Tax=Pyrus ussuriensis x Pyrus communis TaxID=2448454 RepID=A0A5N5FAS8_9ROSA|nr:DNA polymerase epsilon catalytic subunit A-like [Pyrus ussuriensis x Pyrus communis]